MSFTAPGVILLGSRVGNTCASSKSIYCVSGCADTFRIVELTLTILPLKICKAGACSNWRCKTGVATKVVIQLDSHDPSLGRTHASNFPWSYLASHFDLNSQGQDSTWQARTLRRFYTCRQGRNSSGQSFKCVNIICLGDNGCFWVRYPIPSQVIVWHRWARFMNWISGRIVYIAAISSRQ